MRHLSREELDRIILTIPSIGDRASLMSHLVKVGAYSHPHREVVPKKPAASVDPTVVVHKIQKWCDETWAPTSVRTSAILRLIEAIEMGKLTFGNDDAG